MSLIQMDDGKRFIVKESTEEVIRDINTLETRGQGRPTRPGERMGPTFVHFTTVDRTPIYLNTDHIAFVTEEEE